MKTFRTAFSGLHFSNSFKTDASGEFLGWSPDRELPLSVKPKFFSEDNKSDSLKSERPPLPKRINPEKRINNGIPNKQGREYVFLFSIAEPIHWESKIRN